jgi:WD40 repeat protein
VKIWDANNLANRPVVIKSHDAFVMSVAFSPDGKYLVSSGDLADNPAIPNVFYWPTHTSYMAEQMCSEVSRNLTQREWETYVGYDIQYQKTCPNKP